MSFVGKQRGRFRGHGAFHIHRELEPGMLESGSLKWMDLRLGLLINFGAPVFSEAVCRLVNGLG